jgi:hypothetical protein
MGPVRKKLMRVREGSGGEYQDIQGVLFMYSIGYFPRAYELQPELSK